MKFSTIAGGGGKRQAPLPLTREVGFCLQLQYTSCHSSLGACHRSPGNKSVVVSPESQTRMILDFAMLRTLIVVLQSWPLSCSRMELKRELSCRQCSSSTSGPASSASRRICSLSVKTCPHKNKIKTFLNAQSRRCQSESKPCHKRMEDGVFRIAFRK